MFYSSIGNYTKAELLFKRAITIDEKIYGSMHPNMAEDLTLLAINYTYTGNYAKTESLYKRALVIMEKTLGPDHPKVTSMLNSFAYFSARQNDPQKAHELYKKALQIDDRLIEQIMGFTSEDQKMKFLSTKEWSLHAFLSLVSQHLSHDPSAKKDALDVWLKRKGVILASQRRFQEALVYSDDPKAVETFQELSRVRAQLSKLAFAGPGEEGLATYKKKISDFEGQKERLEAKLSRLSQAFAWKQKIAKADCEKVAAALPANTVLMELARVETFNFKAKGKEKRWLPAHYLAFVLHAGEGDKVGMIDLGDAERIDDAVVIFKKDIVNIENVKAAKVAHSAKAIYEMVFEPLRKELGDAREIFISPDGVLNLIPFEVLQGPDGRYLIEDFTFNYLGAGRDVVGFGQPIGKGEGALLMGDPDFDIDPDEKKLTVLKMALIDGEQEKITRRRI